MVAVLAVLDDMIHALSLSLSLLRLTLRSFANLELSKKQSSDSKAQFFSKSAYATRSVSPPQNKRTSNTQKSSMVKSRQVVLNSRVSSSIFDYFFVYFFLFCFAGPTGTPTADNFKVVSVDISEELKDGEVLVKNLWMSVDPYMRGRMNDTKSYIPAFQINQPLSGGAIGEVIKSNNSVPVGAFVSNFNGWQGQLECNCFLILWLILFFFLFSEHFVASGKTVQVIEAKREELADYLGVLGMPGLTAWGGFTQLYFGKPSAGKTVFVSAASGAVGLLVCQLAKLNGNTVIGTAGSQDKIDFLKSVGVDHVINYKER